MSTRLPIFRMAVAAGLMTAPMLAFAQPATTPGATPSPTAPASPSPASPMAPPAMTPPTMAPPATTTAPAGTVPSDRMTSARRASNVIGATVYNERDESIGKIDDLLLSPSEGPMTVVVGVGGFLGIGEKLVSMPMSELTWDGARERWTLAGATKETLQARPTFTYAGSRS